jgi:hypothetical protein
MLQDFMMWAVAARDWQLKVMPTQTNTRLVQAYMQLNGTCLAKPRFPLSIEQLCRYIKRMRSSDS